MLTTSSAGAIIKTVKGTPHNTQHTTQGDKDMKHDISELFKINGKPGFYHERYFDGYGADLDHPKLKGYIKRAHPTTTKTGYIYINIMDGLRKKVFMYGEYTWFDTEAERDAYRVEQNLLREEARKRIYCT